MRHITPKREISWKNDGVLVGKTQAYNSKGLDKPGSLHLYQNSSHFKHSLIRLCLSKA